MVTLTGMKGGNGRAARVISAIVRLSGSLGSLADEIVTECEFATLDHQGETLFSFQLPND